MSLACLQIAKLSMIPTVCILEWILHNKTYTREVKMSVFVVMIGVGVCTVTDVNVNFKGFTAAVVAVISTSLQQIVSFTSFLGDAAFMSFLAGLWMYTAAFSVFLKLLYCFHLLIF